MEKEGSRKGTKERKEGKAEERGDTETHCKRASKLSVKRYPEYTLCSDRESGFVFKERLPYLGFTYDPKRENLECLLGVQWKRMVILLKTKHRRCGWVF